MSISAEHSEEQSFEKPGKTEEFTGNSKNGYTALDIPGMFSVFWAILVSISNHFYYFVVSVIYFETTDI